MLARAYCATLIECIGVAHKAISVQCTIQLVIFSGHVYIIVCVHVQHGSEVSTPKAT